jgi:hypothetical protein
MKELSDTTPAVRASTDRLYWQTDDPVDVVASRLGISRRAVYAAVQPAPAHAPCTECGGPLAYANRSARAAGRAHCRDCGSTATVPFTASNGNSHASDRAVDARAHSVDGRRDARAYANDGWRGRVGALASHRGVVIGGLAAVGLALGAAAAVNHFRD